MYDTVLLPTDGSDCADRAADWAFTLAERTGATVHVLSVVDTRSFSAGLADVEADGSASADRHRFEARARGAVERTVENHAESGVESASTVVDGVPHRAITRYAAEHDADLVVMGTHGWTGLDRFLVGSTTERVVRTADVPVFTVKDRETPAVGDINRVLLPMDRERGAEPAVSHAIDLATTFDATLHVLSVVEAGALLGGMGEPSPYDVLDTIEADAQSVVDDVAERATVAGVESQPSVAVGDPKTAIHDYVEEHGVDLVVMGTHGRTGLSRLVLGSVTERVVRTAAVPVVTVRSFRERDENPGE